MSDKKKGLSNGVKLLLAAVVFGGLPAGGLVYFWQDMHRKIESDAAPAVEAAWTDLQADGFAGFRKWSTQKLLAEMDAGELDRIMAAVGPGQVAWRPLRSYARERKDLMWQFAEFTGRGSGAEVKITLARLYLGRPTVEPKKGEEFTGEGLARNWYLDGLSLIPGKE